MIDRLASLCARDGALTREEEAALVATDSLLTSLERREKALLELDIDLRAESSTALAKAGELHGRADRALRVLQAVRVLVAAVPANATDWGRETQGALTTLRDVIEDAPTWLKPVKPRTTKQRKGGK